MSSPASPTPWLRRSLRRVAARLGANRYSRAQPFIAAVVHRFRGEDLSLRAAGLTYITIFSLVPIATVSFFLMSSLHQVDFQQRLHTFIQDVLGPGVRSDSGGMMDRFLRDTASRPLSWLSLFTLLLSGGSLLKSLDASLNELWCVRSKRPWPTRLLLYLAAMTLGPLLLAVSLTGSWHVRALLALAHVPRAWLALSGILAPVVGLTLLYGFAPNAPVRFKPALGGAVVGGLGWGLARVAYSSFAARLFHYNVVYGSLGAAPLFLLWLYLSWLIVLFGARLAYALQHAEFRDTWPFYELHPRGQELLAARVAQELTRAWREGGLALSLQDIVARIRVPLDTVAAVLDRFEEEGLVVRVKRRYRVARPPAEMTLAQACAAMQTHRRFRRVRSLRQPPEGLADVTAALSEAEDRATRPLRSISWEMLLSSDASAVSAGVGLPGDAKSIALTKS